MRVQPGGDGGIDEVGFWLRAGRAALLLFEGVGRGAGGVEGRDFKLNLGVFNFPDLF